MTMFVPKEVRDGRGREKMESERRGRDEERERARARGKEDRQLEGNSAREGKGEGEGKREGNREGNREGKGETNFHMTSLGIMLLLPVIRWKIPISTWKTKL